MKAFSFFTAAAAAVIMSSVTLMAQDAPYTEKFRYIEVTGTSEVEIVPDEIHFVIGIKEYFEEEFDGVSKPEDYRTKVRIETIESQMREALHSIGISDNDIRTQEVGDYWRERGMDFLIGKNLDITLHDFTMIDSIISVIDTKGVTRTSSNTTSRARKTRCWLPGRKPNIWRRPSVRKSGRSSAS